VATGEDDQISFSGVPGRGNGVNKCYTTAFILTIALGMLNFGYMLESLNPIQTAVNYSFGFTKTDEEKGG